MSKVYILLVNWNGWADTIECLDSLMHLDYSEFRFVIVDNGSTDCSIERIQAWACGALDPIQVGPSSLHGAPTTGRQIEMAEYDQASIETRIGHHSKDSLLTIIKADKNFGFAAGNNLGLRYILERQDALYVWLLNNDTVVDSAALKSMVFRMQSDSKIGICGSTLLFYEKPTHVQALGGGYFCRWFAMVWHLGQRRRFVKPVSTDRVERYLSYVVGASMLVSIDFLNLVGLMTEDYFLYFEEIDWTIKAQGQLRTGYAQDSIVYHKVGRSVGTSSHPGQKSLLCDYYNLRNRLVFTRRYYPYALPTVYLGIFAEGLLRMLFGKWKNAKMAFRLLVSGRDIPPLSCFQNEY